VGLADDLANLEGRETLERVLSRLTNEERDAFMLALGGPYEATVIADAMQENGYGTRMGDLPQAIRDYRIKMRREGRI